MENKETDFRVTRVNIIPYYLNGKVRSVIFILMKEQLYFLLDTTLNVQLRFYFINPQFSVGLCWCSM